MPCGKNKANDSPRKGKNNELGNYPHPYHPPEPPPMDQGGSWELQYCNLIGWTWVHRSDKPVVAFSSGSRADSQPDQEASPRKPRKKKFFQKMFKRKQSPPEEKPTAYDERSQASPYADGDRSTRNARKQQATDDHHCCCCCCCCCGDIQICPCMLQDVDSQSDFNTSNNPSDFNRSNPQSGFNRSNPQSGFSRTEEDPFTQRRDSKSMETQTYNDVRQQGPQTSEGQMSKYRRKPCCTCPCMQHGNMISDENGNVPQRRNGNMPQRRNDNMPQQRSGNMPSHQSGNAPYKNGYNRPEQNYLQQRRDSKCMETQTNTNFKNKPSSCMCRLRCRRVRTVCCPCVMQQMCCPCEQNVQKSSKNINKDEDITYEKIKSEDTNRDAAVEQIINLCLTSNLYKPTVLSNFLKSTNFTTLHKSLDILLKNNTNIMNLINETKELKKEDRTPNFLDLNQSISCLSLDNVKKSDNEHCKLLTAVCDAILSSHKFDNEEFNTVKHASSTSMQKCISDSKMSQHSLSFLKNGGILEKILNELHFPQAILKSKSSEENNVQKEIGIQVKNVSVNKKLEKTFHPMKMVNRLQRNRSRTLLTPKMLKRSDVLKNVGLMKTDPKNNSILKTTTQTENNEKLGTGAEKDSSNKECENVSSKLFLPLNYTSQVLDSGPGPRISSVPPSQAIEQILASVDFSVENSLQNMHSRIEDNQNINLLDATSPPFTDYDLPFNTDQKEETNNKDGKTYSDV